MQIYERLEHEFAQLNSLDPLGMVVCSSGTAALHLGFESLRLVEGSRVALCDFNMIACPRAISMARLKPLFYDCNKHDLLLDFAELPSNSNYLSAILITHIYGRKCNLDHLHSVDRSKVLIVEDLSEAHGVIPHSRTSVACWSFYKNKVICGEEGGAVWFRDPLQAHLARQLRSLGFTEAHDFTHLPYGHNYRMSNIHAKLIRESIYQYPENLAKRQQIEKWYEAYCPSNWKMPPRDVPWVYDIRLPNLSVRDKTISALRSEGYGVRHAFKRMSEQQEYQTSKKIDNPNSLKASQEILYLPITPDVTTEEDCKRCFQIMKSVT